MRTDRANSRPIISPAEPLWCLIQGTKFTAGKAGMSGQTQNTSVSSSLASPGDRLSGLWARIFSTKQRRVIQNKAVSEEGKRRGPRPAGLPSDRVIVSSLGPTARPCLTVCERNTFPRNARDQIPFRGLSLKFGNFRQSFLPASLSALSICASLRRLGQFAIMLCDRDQAFSFIRIGRV